MIELILIGIGIVAVIGAIVLFSIYNSLIQLRVKIDGSWAQIDVELKRRTDLIPNLVETVKGYAKHEKGVFENVTKARSAMMGASTMADKAKADNMLSGALKSLFAVAENYPQLRASENFKQLQDELSNTESKIAYSRQAYNDSVLSYNTAIQTVPSNLVAGTFGFTAREFFKAEGADREPIKVKF